jgi:hypothetical protein
MANYVPFNASHPALPVQRGEKPTSEVRLQQDNWTMTKLWRFKATISMGRKIVEAQSPFQYGTLAAADEAADLFIQDVLNVLVHGEVNNGG